MPAVLAVWAISISIVMIIALKRRWNIESPCNVSRSHLTCDPGDESSGYNTVVAVVNFAGPVSLTEFWEKFLHAIVLKEARFRERMVFVDGFMRWTPAFPSWRPEDNLSVLKSIRRNSIDSLAASMLSRPLDLSRPCWELQFIEKVEGTADADVTSAVIFKYHHAMADGFTMIQKMSSRIRAFDASKSLSELFPPAPMKNGSKTAMAGISEILNFLQSAWTILRMQPDAQGPFRAVNQRTAGEKINIAFSESISLEEVKRIARLGSEKLELGRISVNDVITAIVTRALRSFYLESAPMSTPADLRTVVWVSLNKDMDSSSSWDNANLGFSYITLPVSEKDPWVALGSCHKSLNELKSSAGPLVINTTLRMLGSLPTKIGKRIAKQTADIASASLSNLIGPSAPVYWPVDNSDVTGSGLVDSVFFATSPPFRFGPLVSVISYCGTLYLSVSARDSLLTKQDLDWITAKGLLNAVNDFLTH